MYNSSKLIDGYALESGFNNSFITDWVDIRSYSMVSFSVVFTGGSPAGTLRLQSSNDRQFAGGYAVNTLFAEGAENSQGAIKSISDAVDVSGSDPFEGWGKNIQTVSGAGVYVLDQKYVPYGWVRLTYNASVNANSQLDIFVTLKSDR